ncbi:MAG: aspartate--tRNA ligase [Hyphomicrobium sp.]|uniref:aspartate--tRNA ligase n=1 Tax=Hyphomicrobium sp. TaxID=82 RepID=UPI00132B5F52|nr:aspartate--tRNA ligase [Hyphomicrobium sp.]KAB2942380.1 MAG: aspartate--tRNA ligase [Hyphomicrobium sp.]MBZ0208428.1 aspartate--tRNA ligase [Hyphomicrobium sp.]
MHRYRSHTCGALRSPDIGKAVRLSGWVHRVRDHGGLLFIDLRDHYGITQVVADPDSPAFKTAESVRSEWVIRVDGELRARPEGTVNPELPTGEVELFATEIEVLSAAKELPVPVFGEPDYPEDLRLQYRFLDLRRESLHKNIMQRLAIVASIRKRMVEAGFFEFSTPILTASSPEGARDFLVPSRIHAGKFYALPQAPQQYKQLLMVSGFDRYFQIAPCFRDEDPRADRLPGEFYQLDVEMSFVEQDDIFAAMEPVITGVFEEFSGDKSVTQKWPRIPYDEAIAKYGTDKPDLRNPIEMQDVTEHFRGSGFKIFAGMIEKDPKVRVWAIPAPGGGSRAFCDRMNSWAQGEGQPGLGYIFWRPKESVSIDSEFHQHFSAISDQLVAISGGAGPSDVGSQLTELDRKFLVRILEHLNQTDPDAAASFWSKYYEWSGPLAKNIGSERTEAIRRQLGLNAGDAVFFTAGNPARFYKFAGEARSRIGEELKLIDEGKFALAWIVDFPFYEWNEDEKKIDFSHNPFSMPQGGLQALEAAKSDEERLHIKAYQYDVVCNGYEIASGSVRNHRPDTMVKAFEITGLGQAEVESRFGGLYRAFQYGAPPHGGMAAGIDRIVMLLVGAKNLREVTLFPMNQQASDLLMGAPSEVAPKQLRELHIRVVAPEKKD